MLPPAARPGEGGSPTLVTPRPAWGPGWQSGWVRRRWRPEATAAGGVDGFGGRRRQGRRRPRGGTQSWTCPAPGSVGLLLEEPKERLVRSPLAGSGFGGPLGSCGQPRAPLGPPSSLGKRPAGSYAWGAGCGCGPGAEASVALSGWEEGDATCQRVGVAGLGSLTWTWRLCKAEARQGLPRSWWRGRGEEQRIV